MKKSFAILLISAGVTASSCNGCGGGGGGLWLVGSDGLMANLRGDGTMGPGYNLGGTDDLLGIACRGDQIAFVVGEGATFLRTADAGATWSSVDPGTSAALRDVAVAWDLVYLAGDDGLRVSHDDGDSWTALPGSTRAWAHVSTTDTGEAALAVAADGSVWRWDGAALADTSAPFAARAAVLSHDGGRAAAVGDGGALALSDDGGASWRVLSSGTSADLLAVWAGGDGAVFAVGASGTVVHVDGDVATASQPGAGTLRAVTMDDDRAFAAGDGGAVLESDDAGATWTGVDVQVTGTIYDLDNIE